MKNYILLSCCKDKLPYTAPAEQLYQSEGFKLSLAYARSLKPDGIFILSAKHHLVHLDQLLESYDVCLNDKTAKERQEWADVVVSQLAKYADLKRDTFVILADNTYSENLIKHLSLYSLPISGLSRKERHSWFKEHTLKENTNNCSSASQNFDINDFKNISAMTYAAKHRMLTTGDTILFEDLFRRFPNDGMVHYRMAECLEQQGAYSEASEEYDKAEKLFPMFKYKEMARQDKNRCFAMMGGTNA